MNSNMLIIASILSIVSGAVFCAIAMFLGSPESVKKAAISKQSSYIFYGIGIVTIAYGVFGLVFFRQMPKQAVQVASLVYLSILTILFILYSFLIRGKRK